MEEKLVIALDFDGTCVTHDFPKVGKSIGAEEVLKRLVNDGHKLILFTMRSDEGLADAVNWFMSHNIPLYGIQTNPSQHTWTTSPKAYANVYIDDAALGCPLIHDPKIHKKPFVDWGAVATYYYGG